MSDRADKLPVVITAFARANIPAYELLEQLNEEASRIYTSMRAAERKGRCEFVEIRDATLRRILEVFDDSDYQGRIAVFHFAGHADFDRLLVQDETGEALNAGADGIAEILATHRTLRLVYINGCGTEPQATRLLGLNVPAVITIKEDIQIADKPATDFAVHFYRALAVGASIKDAFVKALGAIKAETHGKEDAPAPDTWILLPSDGSALEWSLPEGQTSSAPASTPLWVNVPPMPVNELVGRDALLGDLAQRLVSGQATAVAMHGMPRVGKKALAVALVYRPEIRERFPDGVLWAALGPQPEIGTILSEWADALDLKLDDLPILSQRVQRLSAKLVDRKVLVVLDDVWNLEDAKLLRLSGTAIRFLLTTQRASIARAFAGVRQQVEVPALDDAAAYSLLQQLAPEACAANPEATRALAAGVGGLPLAITLLGGYLTAPENFLFPEQALNVLQKSGAAKQLSPLQEVVRMSLDWLEQTAPQALEVFYRCGAFAPKPAQFDLPAAQAVTGAAVEDLSLLADLHLIEVDRDKRITLHKVLADSAGKHTPEDAVKEHAEYYCKLIDAERENWHKIALVYPQASRALQRLQPGDETITAWVDALRLYWDRRSLYTDYLRWAQRALEIAKARGDVKTEGKLCNNIGHIYTCIGDDAAMRYLEKSLECFRAIQAKAGEAKTLNNMGIVCDAQHDYGRARTYYEQALALFHEMEDCTGEAAAFNNLGLVYSALNEPDLAQSAYDQALRLFRQTGDEEGEADAMGNIGSLYVCLNKQEQALVFLNQALELFRILGSAAGEAHTLVSMATMYYDAGDWTRARSCFEQALDLVRQVGDKKQENLIVEYLERARGEEGVPESATSTKWEPTRFPVAKLLENTRSTRFSIQKSFTRYPKNYRQTLARPRFSVAKSRSDFGYK